ncbi:MAG: ComF family protein [Oscillospiraceae bacterium]|nr:ComF family protein [Oscillospiraceae bacterium]
MIKIISNILNIFFPKKCIFCSDIIEITSLCCSTCYLNLPFTKISVCNICSKNNCICGDEKWFFDKIICPFSYQEPVITSIKNFKFRDKINYAKTISRYMTNKLNEFPKIIKETDLIIPIPMTPKDKFKRGFNQSEIIAKNIGKALNIDTNFKIMIKQRATEKQHKLNKKQRKLNLINAYKCIKPEYIQGKNILICDDVSTTGSTLNIFSHCLKQNGAKKISCIIFATTQL